MNYGLIFKSAREMWPSTLFCGTLLCGTEGIIAYVLPALRGQFSEGLLQIEFIRTIVGAMMGVDVEDRFGPEMFTALPWVHPVVLALVWAHAIMSCTRLPAGEIDRGTVDILLGLPVTRWGVMRSESLVWLGNGAVLLAMAVLGNVVGNLAVEESMRPDLTRTLIVVANLMCLYVAVGGISWFVSAASDRRGKAVAVVFAVVLASFLLNYLAQFWQPADDVVFLSLLNYYRPLFVLRDGTWPIGDMAILSAVGVGLWIAAGLVFARRDICTV